MKNLTAKQIEQIKRIKSFERISYHGNRKYVGSLPIKFFVDVVNKKRKREILNSYNDIMTISEKVRSMIQFYKSCVGTSYEKRMILGNTGIYLASPIFGHSDYNKCRMFDINEKTLKLMSLFNSLIQK